MTNRQAWAQIGHRFGHKPPLGRQFEPGPGPPFESQNIWTLRPPDCESGASASPARPKVGVSSCLPTPVYGLPGEPPAMGSAITVSGEIPAVLTFVFALPVSGRRIEQESELF